MQIKAAIARAVDEPLSIEWLTLEEPRSDEILVRLVASGICHTDMAMRDHKIYPIPHPVVLGHEGAGVVVRVGCAVSKVEPGDHVVLFADSCGRCRSCLDSYPTYCSEFYSYNFMGTRADGTSPLSQGGSIVHIFQHQSSFATHTLCRERNVIKVTKSVPLEVLAPLGCGIVTGAGAIINSLSVRPGASVVIFGVGSVGLSAVMAAKLLGACQIVAVDLFESRLSLARELGATQTINPTCASVVDSVQRIAPGGVDFTLDTTGDMSVLSGAIDILARRGVCGFVGGAPKGATLAIDAEHVMTGGRSIRGIIEGDANPDRFIPTLVELFQLGRFPMDKLITFYPFDQINAAIADSMSGMVIKPVLRISDATLGVP